MSIATRLRPALVFSSKHLLISLIIASLSAALVLGVWYPHPFDQVAGGRDLFTLILSVDVVMGPLLSLVVYNPQKPRGELVRDIGIIALLQLSALGYGLYSSHLARPIHLAFEGDRFRTVAIADLQASDGRRAFSLSRLFTLKGPEPIGVELAVPSDADYMESINLAISGFHYAFQPHRWVSYAEQKGMVLSKAKTVDELRNKHPSHHQRIDQLIREQGLNETDLLYHSLFAGYNTDWVVLIDRNSAEIVGYLPFDGW